MQLRRTLIGVLALLGTLAMPEAAKAGPVFTPVGTLDRFPQEAIDAFGPEVTEGSNQFIGGTLLPVLEAGQLWQLYWDPSTTRTYVLVRDADSHKVTGSFVLPGALDRATSVFGGEWLHATDGARRVYVVSGNSLLEIDTATYAVRHVANLGVEPSPFSTPFTVGGLGYDDETGDVLVLYGGPAAFFIANKLTVLQRIDLTTGARQSRIVRSCPGPLPATDVGATYAAELLPGGDAVFVVCQRQLAAPHDSPVAETRALVVRLPRASLWDVDGQETSVDVGEWFDSALVDPDSGRIAVLHMNRDVTVVDTAAMGVVGRFPIGAETFAPTGAGLNRSTGRYFFLSPAGVGHVDIRSTPLPAPVVDASLAAEGQERIVPDGNKAYVLPGTAIHNTKADHYTIYNVAH